MSDVTVTAAPEVEVREAELDHEALGFTDALVIGPIVVGTTSERPLTGVILGAVPHKLVHRAERPVLVVPIPAEVHA